MDSKATTLHIVSRLVILLCGLSVVAGCQVNRESNVFRAAALASIGTAPRVVVKPVSQHHGINLVNRLSNTIPDPTERTQILLRKYDLQESYTADPDSVIEWLIKLADNRPTLEEVHSLSELALLQANWSAEKGDNERAIRLYATALIYAHQFLFSEKLDIARNAYDPQFRSICDIYNRSLESILRETCSREHIRPNESFIVGTGARSIEFDVRLDGRWKNQKFERFELARDYNTTGLENQYLTYGLGVPLIGVWQKPKEYSRLEEYYPPELTLAMTAFVHLREDVDSPSGWKAELRMYDPLEKTVIRMGNKNVPLESDITTPLAYSLRDPALSKGILATASLLDAGIGEQGDLYGMFMTEPYDPDKIPVVMVHGFWSSPFTWLHMFNDLRASRDIRENYQFWFYSYPTGQPFWFSARDLREKLAKMKRDLDPRGDSKSLDQMILVGHSMGGLVSMLQVTESEDHFWDAISQHSVEEFQGEPQSLERMRSTFFFHPNDSVDRVITIATPYQGSEFANAAARWVSHKLFTLPSVVQTDFEKIVSQNSDKVPRRSLIHIPTSIDSLSPDSPIFEAFDKASRPQSVRVHNIYGNLEKRSFFKSSTASETQGSDGVVSVRSASHPKVDSQLVVDAEHQQVHQHPAAIFEVRRILLENLAEYDRVRVREIPEIPRVRQATRLEPIYDYSAKVENAVGMEVTNSVSGEIEGEK